MRFFFRKSSMFRRSIPLRIARKTSSKFIFVQTLQQKSITRTLEQGGRMQLFSHTLAKNFGRYF